MGEVKKEERCEGRREEGREEGHSGAGKARKSHPITEL